MQLVSRSIAGRAFFPQFTEILGEFGEKIPWLRPAQDLRFITNSAYFRRKLESLLGCPEGGIVCYQLTAPTEGREYVGGVLYFPHSPERLVDPHNQALVEQLERAGASYISCLQVREVLRGAGHGTELLHKAMKTILRKHPVVWAVCEPELLPWYQAGGAAVLNRPHNNDNLALIRWTA